MENLSFLFIEDDEIEVLKFKKSLKKLGFTHKILEAKNGEEALDILKKKQELPNVILLDLNMPKMNGLEFLKELKEDPHLRYIPAIIVTTSNNHQDMLESYNLGIAGYIIKPLRYEDYIKKIQRVVDYWMVNEVIEF
ncbi:response regulator receiver domain-containing protein [Kordia periserrulae]|jgi:CheY-like chemotaxis protein|uniref:Response regulator receiver domain-containing protein n=1 Tax=Kordia periserrulae TaxID=701523 RepID=A0A2T6C639_9FLAO|nr:response regulator [Kordia periserrulae]KAB8156112.1 response regulator [Kordia sp. TARA_039_SRF]PTX63746.1 response regulator receiver domain-containing protein [Kordia periserrulae]